ncbi:hypothetical protein AAG906_023511 [Vitis piasezkii]
MSHMGQQLLICMLELVSVKCIEINEEAKLSFEKTVGCLPMSIDSTISWHHADTPIGPLSWLLGSDVVVVDPPRNGLDPYLVDALQTISFAEKRTKSTERCGCASVFSKVKNEKRPWILHAKEASVQTEKQNISG